MAKVGERGKAMRGAALRQRVCEVNRGLVRAGLVVLAFGNASAVDRDAGVVAIKPSGVDYASLEPEDIVIVSLEGGQVVDGDARPSSDTPTHLVLYRSFPTVGGIIHTHSPQATSWAQARRELPCLGTTHADHFHGPVPVTRAMTDEEIAVDYELNTGRVIVERFNSTGLDPDRVPACLDASHGPFVWGPTPEAALDNAIALEQVAVMAIATVALAGEVEPIGPRLLDKHFLRKHGPAAYYGQAAPRPTPKR
jgi:L-ribulose-5-phosphate 4-epimerase